MNITIIGLGLIGGSMALDLREKGLGRIFTGVERSAENAEKALELGLVDEILPLDSALKKAQIILLAIPVAAAIRLAPKILDKLNHEQVLIDLSSTKHRLEQAVAGHAKRDRLVSAHPMSGTEFSGPAAAMPHLFKNKIAIICNREKCAGDALQKALDLFEALEMKPDFMESEDHDVHAAYVSHISHVSSFSLALTVLAKEADHALDVRRMAAGGFLSTVRLAKSSPETWESILMDNSRNMSAIIDEYITQLTEFRNILESGDSAALKQRIAKANEIREVIENIEESKKAKINGQRKLEQKEH